MESRDTTAVCLFDVDGTLTAPRQKITREVQDCLKKLNKKMTVGLVGGSDLVKIVEQMGGDNSVIKEYDYLFAENGVMAYKKGEKIGEQSLQKRMGEENIQKVINFCLHYMSKLNLPVKRGTFIEFRNSMMNICPVGRSCSQAERLQFVEYDQKHNLRKKFVDALYNEFPSMGLKFVIGGQISIDIYPEGWDKSYCLQYMQKDGFKTIHFFGDKTQKGGNDHEIYEDPRTIGHSVKSPQETLQLLEELFFKD